jgi:hypothetical protein
MHHPSLLRHIQISFDYSLTEERLIYFLHYKFVRKLQKHILLLHKGYESQKHYSQTVLVGIGSPFLFLFIEMKWKPMKSIHFNVRVSSILPSLLTAVAFHSIANTYNGSKNLISFWPRTTACGWRLVGFAFTTAVPQMRIEEKSLNE